MEDWDPYELPQHLSRVENCFKMVRISNIKNVDWRLVRAD